MYIFKGRKTKRIGDVDMGEAAKFFGVETANRLRDGVLAGAINKHGSVVFRINNPC